MRIRGKHLLVLLASLLMIAPSSGQLAAQSTVTAFKTGERTTGTTKQCYYSFAGSDYTRTFQSYEVCPVSIQVRTAASSQPPRPAPSPSPSTVTAFKTGERTTGTTKQCYYSFAGNEYTRTVQSYEVCPVSIQVRTGG